jgi:hypothetical protein
MLAVVMPDRAETWIHEIVCRPGLIGFGQLGAAGGSREAWRVKCRQSLRFRAWQCSEATLII